MNYFQNFLLYSLLIITIIVVVFYSCKLFGIKHYSNEGFQNNSDGLSIKRTSNFTKVYSNKMFHIWEPEPIDDYFPIGQYITKSSTPPVAGILVKGTDANDKPVTFSLISKTKDKVGIWNPEPHDNYVTMGHVFSKNIPSIHSIRCLKLEDVIEDELSDRYIDSSKFDIWTLNKSDLFLASKVNNKKELPKTPPYTINPNQVEIPTKLRTKTTKSYTFIGSFINKEISKRVSIYRPNPPSGYISIGDIVTINNEDPNNSLESTVIHLDDIKYPLGFGDSYVAKIIDTELDSNDIYTVWNPIAPPGYVCLGHVMNKSKQEPNSTDIIGCVPFEYINILKGSDLRTEVWNNKPENNYITFLTDSNDRFIVKKRNQRNDVLFQLNEDFLSVELDKLDFPKDCLFTYTLNTNNVIDYDEEERSNYLINTLSNRFDVSRHRFQNLKYDIENKTISMTIMSRPINSDECTVNELITHLRNTILETIFKINNEKGQTISTLTSFKVVKGTNDIIINNSQFLNNQT